MSRRETGIVKRCGCRDPDTGRQAGGRCALLPKRGHGTWYLAVELPRPGRPQKPRWPACAVLAGSRAGMSSPRLHDLRHGAATLALAAGADLKAIQAMLGLASIALTADTYTSVLPDLARHAAEAIAAEIPRAAWTPPGSHELLGLTLASPGPHQGLTTQAVSPRQAT